MGTWTDPGTTLNYKERVLKKSYIRKEKYRPATTTAVYVTLRLPPLDSETGGLESSSQKPISSFGETKKEKKNFSKFVLVLIFYEVNFIKFFEIFRFLDHFWQILGFLMTFLF